MPVGVLTIKVIEASGNILKEGSGGVHCVLSIGPKKYQTASKRVPILKKEVSWNETFTFEVHDTSEQVFVTVWKSSKVVGRRIILLAHVGVNEKPSENWYQLTDKSKNPAGGVIKLSISYHIGGMAESSTRRNDSVLKSPGHTSGVTMFPESPSVSSRSTESADQRFIDYFVLAKLKQIDPKKANVQKCYLQDDGTKSSLVFRYPAEDHSDLALLEENVNLFGFPSSLAYSDTSKPPSCHHFALTVNEDRVYGSSLVFWRKLEIPASHGRLYEPCTMMLLSRHPFLDVFSDVLKEMYLMFYRNEDEAIPSRAVDPDGRSFFSYVMYLCEEVPLPNSTTDIQFSMVTNPNPSNYSTFSSLKFAKELSLRRAKKKPLPPSRGRPMSAPSTPSADPSPLSSPKRASKPFGTNSSLNRSLSVGPNPSRTLDFSSNASGTDEEASNTLDPSQPPATERRRSDPCDRKSLSPLPPKKPASMNTRHPCTATARDRSRSKSVETPPVDNVEIPNASQTCSKVRTSLDKSAMSPSTSAGSPEPDLSQVETASNRSGHDLERKSSESELSSRSTGSNTSPCSGDSPRTTRHANAEAKSSASNGNRHGSLVNPEAPIAKPSFDTNATADAKGAAAASSSGKLAAAVLQTKNAPVSLDDDAFMRPDDVATVAMPHGQKQQQHPPVFDDQTLDLSRIELSDDESPMNVDNRRFAAEPRLVKTCLSDDFFTFSHLDVNLYEDLFCVLDTHTIVKMFCCILCEMNVIFYSSQRSTLVKVQECLKALLFPFVWAHIYIPLLPKTLLHVIEAPVPFMVGVQRDNLAEVHESKQATNSEIVLVDIDASTIEFGKRLPFFPSEKRKSLVKDIRLLIRPNVFEADNVLKQEFIPRSEKLQVALRSSFLRFLASLLGDYRGFLYFANGQTPIFNTTTFLQQHSDSAPFLSRFLQTQMFSHFMQRHLQDPALLQDYVAYLGQNALKPKQVITIPARPANLPLDRLRRYHIPNDNPLAAPIKTIVESQRRAAQENTKSSQSSCVSDKSKSRSDKSKSSQSPATSKSSSATQNGPPAAGPMLVRQSLREKSNIEFSRPPRKRRITKCVDRIFALRNATPKAIPIGELTSMADLLKILEWREFLVNAVGDRLRTPPVGGAPDRVVRIDRRNSSVHIKQRSGSETLHVGLPSECYDDLAFFLHITIDECSQSKTQRDYIVAKRILDFSSTVYRQKELPATSHSRHSSFSTSSARASSAQHEYILGILVSHSLLKNLEFWETFFYYEVDKTFPQFQTTGEINIDWCFERIVRYAYQMVELDRVEIRKISDTVRKWCEYCQLSDEHIHTLNIMVANLYKTKQAPEVSTIDQIIAAEKGRGRSHGRSHELKRLVTAPDSPTTATSAAVTRQRNTSSVTEHESVVASSVAPKTTNKKTRSQKIPSRTSLSSRIPQYSRHSLTEKSRSKRPNTMRAPSSPPKGSKQQQRGSHHRAHSGNSPLSMSKSASRKSPSLSLEKSRSQKEAPPLDLSANDVRDKPKGEKGKRRSSWWSMGSD